MNILPTISVTSVAGKTIAPLLRFIWGKFTQNSRDIVKYKTAVRRSGMYDHNDKDFGEMCNTMLYRLSSRHSIDDSRKYGFWHVVEDEHIDNPEKFLKFIVASQNKGRTSLSFDEVKFLLKR